MRLPWLVLSGLTTLVLLAPLGSAPHFFRGGGGCTEADGNLTDDPGAPGEAGATVLLLHNSFNDLASGTPVTRVAVGESVTWRWASLHCHSVTQGVAGTSAGGFDSGYVYPTQAGEVPVLPGFFHYPVPELEQQDLTYTHTFTEPGTFTYYCVHHTLIGMNGVVIVE